MPNTQTASAPDTRICRDNMQLTVTNIRPDLPKKPDRQARQEIESRLYRIFKKYA